MKKMDNLMYKMMSDDQTQVPDFVADTLIFVILGTKETLLQTIEKLKPFDDNELYFVEKISRPLSKICSLYSGKLKINIEPDADAEIAQVHTYAEGYDSNIYMILNLKMMSNNRNILAHVKFNIARLDPGSVLDEWIDKIENVPKTMTDNVKLIAVIGKNSRTMIVATQI